MTRPIQASLDLQALKQNLSIVRQAAPHARVWSVVKANAYGHGIERIWSALGATDGFALLNLEEAITLRERGWKGPDHLRTQQLAAQSTAKCAAKSTVGYLS